MSKYRDITAEIGPLYRVVSGDNPKIPMYSYERAAYVLWQSIFEALQESGKTEKEAIDWLQSKEPRWALDSELGDSLRKLGKSFIANQN